MVLSNLTTLVLGASPRPERFSNEAIRKLLSCNIPVIAIGKRETDLGYIKIRKGMPRDIGGVHTITLYLSAKNQKEYYDYILSLSPSRIIFNPGTFNPELITMAVKKGITVINNCMLVMLNNGIY
jgi:predicted CoA-binding protein